MQEKNCTRCGATKTLDLFPNLKKAKDGKSPWCKACHVQRKQEWRAENPEAYKARYDAQWRKNRERHYANTKAWREANPQKAYDIGLKTRYGVPLGTYARLLEEQGGRCAICQSAEPGGAKRNKHLTRFALDHCHETGVVRGLLCLACNTGIGQFRHLEEVLGSAIEYLRRYPAINPSQKSR